MSLKRSLSVVVTLLAVMFVAASILRAEEPTKNATPSKAQPALDQLKKLQGEWVWAEGEQKGELVARYTVSSAGTVVVENLFPGTDHEMVTVYHLDGDKLMLTHYCAVGNQPQMHAEPATDKLVFVCTGGSNMTESDGHMHAMTMTFIDNNHVRAEWTYKEGTSTPHVKVISYERKK